MNERTDGRTDGREATGGGGCLHCSGVEGFRVFYYYLLPYIVCCLVSCHWVDIHAGHHHLYHRAPQHVKTQFLPLPYHAPLLYHSLRLASPCYLLRDHRGLDVARLPIQSYGLRTEQVLHRQGSTLVLHGSPPGAASLTAARTECCARAEATMSPCRHAAHLSLSLFSSPLQTPPGS